MLKNVINFELWTVQVIKFMNLFGVFV